MNASERRQQLLEVLCQRRQDTVENLASEFGVSERTIRRDIGELTLQYPIETKCGRHGVRVADWYRMDSKRLTAKQADLLRRLSVSLSGDDLETMNRILAQFAS